MIDGSARRLLHAVFAFHSASVSSGGAPATSPRGHAGSLALAHGVTKVTVSASSVRTRSSTSQFKQQRDLRQPRQVDQFRERWTFTAANNQQNAQEPLQFTLAARRRRRPRRSTASRSKSSTARSRPPAGLPHTVRKPACVGSGSGSHGVAAPTPVISPRLFGDRVNGSDANAV